MAEYNIIELGKELGLTKQGQAYGLVRLLGLSSDVAFSRNSDRSKKCHLYSEKVLETCKKALNNELVEEAQIRDGLYTIEALADLVGSTVFTVRKKLAGLTPDGTVAVKNSTKFYMASVYLFRRAAIALDMRPAEIKAINDDREKEKAKRWPKPAPKADGQQFEENPTRFADFGERKTLEDLPEADRKALEAVQTAFASGQPLAEALDKNLGTSENPSMREYYEQKVAAKKAMTAEMKETLGIGKIDCPAIFKATHELACAETPRDRMELRDKLRSLLSDAMPEFKEYWIKYSTGG
jgi:hypothetical protein